MLEGFAWIVAIFLALALLIGGAMWGLPQYGVWQQSLSGRAELARAEANRQIRVREAQAALDAADLTAQAEIRRAQGVAEANRILSDSLGGSESYLRWRYIEMLEATASGGNQIIYVPTEAALPILEAQRLERRN